MEIFSACVCVVRYVIMFPFMCLCCGFCDSVLQNVSLCFEIH